MKRECDTQFMACSECFNKYDTQVLEIEIYELMLKTYCPRCMDKITKQRKEEKNVRARKEKVLRERGSL